MDQCRLVNIADLIGIQFCNIHCCFIAHKGQETNEDLEQLRLKKVCFLPR